MYTYYTKLVIVLIICYLRINYWMICILYCTKSKHMVYDFKQFSGLNFGYLKPFPIFDAMRICLGMFPFCFSDI